MYFYSHEFFCSNSLHIYYCGQGIFPKNLNELYVKYKWTLFLLFLLEMFFQFIFLFGFSFIVNFHTIKFYS